jgi:3-dehydroquinate synthase
LDSIKRSIEIKKTIVDQDPKEKGIRKILNFGHTLGHAFESISLLTNAPLLHGEAVALGMIYEAKLTLVAEEINIIKKSLESKNLPTSLEGFEWSKGPNFGDQVWDYCLKDKKNSNGIVRMALLESLGKCAWNIHINKDQVTKVLNLS